MFKQTSERKHISAFRPKKFKASPWHVDNNSPGLLYKYIYLVRYLAGSRGSSSSELGIPSEISIYSNHGGDHFEPNIRLEEHNFSRGQSSNIPHVVRASISNTDGQLRDILPDMESNDLDDQVRNTQSDVEPIDIEYYLRIIKG